MLIKNVVLLLGGWISDIHSKRASQTVRMSIRCIYMDGVFYLYLFIYSYLFLGQKIRLTND